MPLNRFLQYRIIALRLGQQQRRAFLGETIKSAYREIISRGSLDKFGLQRIRRSTRQVEYDADACVVGLGFVPGQTVLTSD